MTGNVQIPEGVYPSVCPVCSEKFRYSQTLRRHIQKQHRIKRGEKEFEEWFRGLKRSQPRGSYEE